MQNFSKISDVLKKFDPKKDRFISREFQKYGYDLAQELGDPKRVSFYIKLSKDNPRGLIETARNFVKDAYNVRSKSRLFVWKLMELKKKKNENAIS